MKQCTECGSTYSPRIDFCFYDGSELIAAVEEVSTASGPFDLDDSMDLPSLGGAPARSAGAGAAATMTPLPLAQHSLPAAVLERGAGKAEAPPEDVPPASPLAAPPPPATEPIASPLAAPPPPPSESRPAPERASDGTTDPPASPRDGPPPAALHTAEPVVLESQAPAGQDEDEGAAGVPLWVWGAGAVGLVAVLGAVVFALGGLSAVGAAFNARVGPDEIAATAEPPSDPPTAAPDAEEEDRFPVAPLQVGLAAVDEAGIGAPTDTDSDVDSDLGTGVDVDAAEGDPIEAPDGVGTAEAGDRRDPSTTSAGSSSPDGGGASGDAAGGTERPATAPDPAPTPQPVRTPDPVRTPTPPAGSAEPEPAPDPWGAPPAPVASDAVTVNVSMDGGGAGLKLFVDGQEQAGNFPFVLKLGQGMHRFKVRDASGKEYEIGKPIRKGPSGSMSLQLFPP